MRNEDKTKEQIIDELIDELLELRRQTTELKGSKSESKQLPESPGMKIGEILIEMGYLHRSQLEEALRRQSEASGHRHKRLGQILIESGNINSEQLKLALEEQIIRLRASLMEEMFWERDRKAEEETKKPRDYTDLLKGFYQGEIYDFTGANVTYADMSEDVVIQVSQRGITGMDNTPAVLFNVELSNADYCQRVQEEITLAQPDVVAAAEAADLDIGSLLLIYLLNAIKYGHIDPNAGPVELSIGDWEGWTGECMWREVYADVREYASYKRRTDKISH
jgi:hypothetical protein